LARVALNVQNLQAAPKPILARKNVLARNDGNSSKKAASAVKNDGNPSPAKPWHRPRPLCFLPVIPNPKPGNPD